MTTPPLTSTDHAEGTDVPHGARVTLADTANRSFVEELVDDAEWDAFVDGYEEAEWEHLLHRWDLWRRPAQTTPPTMGGRHSVWNIRAGRGFGKTRTGAETVREVIDWAPIIALVAPTAPDVRDVMVEGESGVMSVFPKHQRPKYEPSKRRITFHNGARATTFSADEPERLRGPQFHWGWFDEPASMRRGSEAWDNFELGLRLGRSPWALLTGTPKPLPWLRALTDDPGTVTTTGSTYENYGNLSEVFVRRILARYEGTRMGRQELWADYLDDVEGALWMMLTIEQHRRTTVDRTGHKTIVAVDPPGETAECGIVVAGAPARPADTDHAYVLDDASMPGRPEEWGAQVVAAWRRWNADEIVVEKNQGGDMVRSTIHAVDPTAPVRKINAGESKRSRAEPIAALYARGRVHHVGAFGMLEAQMTTWVPGETKSPDRLDALVHAVTDLLPQTSVKSTVVSLAKRRIAL